MSRRLSAIFTSGLSSEDRSGPASGSASPRRMSPTDTRSKSPGKLSKQPPAYNTARRPSGQQFLTPAEPTLPSLQQLQDGDAALMPPPSITAAGYHARNESRDRSRPGTPGNYSRPVTPSIQLPDQPSITPQSPNDAAKEKKKHWWSSNKKKDDASNGPVAWIAGHPQRVPYDTDGLINPQPAQDLWDNTDGNCFVYLYPRTSGRGATFKVDSAVFASSPVLTKLAFGDIYSNAAVVSGDRRQMPLEARTQHLSMNDPATPPLSPKRNAEGTSSTSSRDSRGHYSQFSEAQEAHLYLPVKLSSDGAAHTPQGPTSTRPDGEKGAMEDLQTLIDYRNFFAFLCGQSLVATERRSTFFHIFLTIAGILKSFQFSNVDGSTYGEVANSSFDNYIEELGLADVRTSREKTIEGAVLGERMKNVLLYNEAFTHAVGKHSDLLALKSPKFAMISPITQNRLTRAAMDLEKRVASIRLIMTDFDFPFLFSGIMNSKTSIERKEGVRFDQWKEHFLGMRKFIMGMYKQRYGDWPPKASSKKNSLETSGLNRLVLRDVYHDLSSLYDLLVDRNHLTTRTIDGVNEDGGRDEPVVRGLRAVLSEYDRSSPPVKPPMPFDLPRLPSLKHTRPEFGQDAKKDAKAMQKKIKDDELQKLLRSSWNDDARVTPFVDAFREMEKRAAHGCTMHELEDIRIGQWIFMYTVLQALPMLACDAPGLKWTKAVEYFLCEPPRSGVPWANPNAAGAGGNRRTWFSVGGEGGGVVSLPSDIVEHGVEGIYRRSHCWEMAEKWCASNPILSAALNMQQQSNTGAEYDDPLPAPPSGNDLLRPDSRTSNRSGTSRASKRYSSFGLGLEALPLPAGVTPDGSAPSPMERPRTPAHSVDTSKTFDSILGGTDVKNAKGKKKK
ncbi:hypothetical protein CLAFUW4_03545 [Fulvia fulva]|uniref:DUF8004 domain-containing protein n=1 Tax=Passalora fulva TaxID=5499 RepID=A0A9Q8P4V8_PASFU|nr:uncharacterized protein CLAFUR5_03525 [Fulvia fulva]KAK4631434.1 hypothetical protein CLAFUR4_03534 [Fulvia fulva]KAK4632907.1 hypothetical protein CLAFUR0_03539 [Fulvia fulva]UJO13500.1 hypothetical protein CLAFUR5_03525 [Fulvia fulva]WPV10753.1 hypothetical protein CLAFUW4_03545 [Fulvia fulva]WPV25376.1 hypothetical protein CLAFUW7_03537 [Fulvia fulva]